MPVYPARRPNAHHDFLKKKGSAAGAGAGRNRAAESVRGLQAVNER